MLQHISLGNDLYAFLDSNGQASGPVIKTLDASIMDTIAAQITTSMDTVDEMFLQVMELSIQPNSQIQVLGVLKPFTAESTDWFLESEWVNWRRKGIIPVIGKRLIRNSQGEAKIIGMVIPIFSNCKDYVVARIVRKSILSMHPYVVNVGQP